MLKPLYLPIISDFDYSSLIAKYGYNVPKANQQVTDWSRLELYAARNYNNPFCCSRQEFLLDIKRLKTLQRLLALQDPPPRATLNVFVVMFNLFGANAETLILETTPIENRWKIPPFLDKIGRLRRFGIRMIDGSVVNLDEDPREASLITALERI